MPGRTYDDAPLPQDTGSYDALVLAEVYDRVNARVSGPLPRFGRRAVWAVMRAVREEFPDGGYDPEDMVHRDRVARRAGMTTGVVRLMIAQKVMRAMLTVAEASQSVEPARCDLTAGTHTTPHRGCVLR